MSWREDYRLRDLDQSYRIEATCRQCGHSRLYAPNDLLQLCPHRDARIAEIVDRLHCMRPHCRAVGVRLLLLRPHKMGAFIAGLP